jgi:hypothetical protein
MSLFLTENNVVDNTTAIFDNFYNMQMSVPTEQYNLVYSFFQGVCGTTEIANNFTAFLFIVASMSGIDALTIIDNLKGDDNKLKIDQKFAYYLNSFKSKTNLYGVAVAPKPVQPVARNVVI